MDAEEPCVTQPQVVRSWDAGPTDDLGGDPACWAALLCPNCGAVPNSREERDGGRCARCGELFPLDD